MTSTPLDVRLVALVCARPGIDAAEAIYSLNFDGLAVRRTLFALVADGTLRKTGVRYWPNDQTQATG